MTGCTGECKLSLSQRIAPCFFPPIENSSSHSMQKSRCSIKKRGGSVVGLLVFFWRHKQCIRNMDVVFSFASAIKRFVFLEISADFLSFKVTETSHDYLRGQEYWE